MTEGTENAVSDHSDNAELKNESTPDLSGILSSSSEINPETNQNNDPGEAESSLVKGITVDNNTNQENNPQENNQKPTLSLSNAILEKLNEEKPPENNENPQANEITPQKIFENSDSDSNPPKIPDLMNDNQSTSTMQYSNSSETVEKSEIQNNVLTEEEKTATNTENTQNTAENNDINKELGPLSSIIHDKIDDSPLFHTEANTQPNTPHEENKTDDSTPKPENQENLQDNSIKSEEEQKTDQQNDPKPVSKHDLKSSLNLDFAKLSNQQRSQTTLASDRKGKTSRPFVTRKEEKPQIALSSPKKKRSLAEQLEASERLAQCKKYPEPQHNRIMEHAQTSRKPRPKTMLYNDHKRTNHETELKAPPEFIEMITGTPLKKEDPPNLLSIKNKEKESKVSSEEVIKMTDRILSGQKLNLYDPATIADIINELSNRRIQALRDQDYEKSKKMEQVVSSLRIDYRKRDRDLFYQDYVDDIKQRYDEGKENLKNTDQDWKNKLKQYDEMCLEELKALQEKQAGQNADLEEYWKSDEAYRKFNKKSPHLLLALQNQKNYALTGDLTGAAFLQRITRKLEAQEVEERATEMQLSYDRDKASLINSQKNEITNLKQFHEVQRHRLVKQYNNEMEICRSRIKTLEKMVEESSDFDKFCAKKFKKGADFVVPMSATINGGTDIPTCGKMRAMPRNKNILKSFRESVVSSPLQLPGVKMSKQTLRVIDKKPKKKQPEF